jgi:hypothetical protein
MRQVTLWATLFVPLSAGAVARYWAEQDIAIGSIDAAVAPYGVLGERYAVRDGQVVAFAGGPSLRPVNASVPPDTGTLAFDVAERVFWSVEDTVYAADLLTGAVATLPLEAEVLDLVVGCEGALALTSDARLVRWSVGVEPSTMPLERAMAGLFPTADCRQVGAWDPAGIGLVDLGTGVFRPVVRRDGVRSVVRDGEGFLAVDAQGVTRWSADGAPSETWLRSDILWVCDPIGGLPCVVDRSGSVWLLR